MTRQAKESWRRMLEASLRAAKKSSWAAAQMDGNLKNNILGEAARLLELQKNFLMKENRKDLRQATSLALSAAMMDRLTLTPKRIAQMAEGVRTVRGLKDPIGKVLAQWKRPNGLRITKESVPLGVILIIYESRPNVTVECASLCLKSGNSVLLRGGREAFHSNKALAGIFEKALQKFKAPKGIVQFIRTTDRSAVDFLLQRDDSIHLVIPRGGESLIRKVVAASRIPVIKHYQGICHVYIDQAADLRKAAAIAYNAKMQRPGVCNAMETLLVHRKIAKVFWEQLGPLLQAGGCEVRGDAETRRWLPWARQVKSSDYGREFLDKIVAVRTVPDIQTALDHIRKFGSGHTEAIVTKNKKTARLFREQVDASSVMLNASTRFSDGFEYGFGAEIGISTDKIHARGPMGLEGLTSYKYIVEGHGQIRQ